METATSAIAGSGAMDALLLDGKCVFFDEFDGNVPFAGMAGGKGVEGKLHWRTHPPGRLENVFGMESRAGDGQRDVTLMLIDCNDEENEDGKLITIGMDFDFIRRLHGGERDAGDELLGMVMGHSEHFGAYDIQTL